ncbi:MAG: serine--tRNA ligase [Candidatus Nealsonbacteria bacterium RBG_13_42_11]|uniref:Serine--tRNA ligase n=1 Tax=Candidatus Nealsonbacteria bacterium RBG_13_42_11 TaxID=1801663 RepID=A0A1G2DYB6_9BACT|nr:MAG: serine--tRNA ligase [Candidatus Nealsonbacteria bacterium RBG_13_42_11]
MLDIKFIRENPDIVKQGAKNKGYDVDIDRLLELDKRRREILQALEDMRAKKNKVSKEFPQIRGEEEKNKILLEMKELDANSDRIWKTLKEIDQEFNDLMLQVPNIPQEDVPVGKDDSENKVVEEIGEKTKFDFKFNDYLSLGENLDLIDIKRAAKVAGTRFGYLKGGAVLMEFALINLAFENLIKEKFIPVLPPVLLKEGLARGTGYFESTDREEAYFIPEDKFYLVGTSEQSLLALHAGEILEEKDLPRRYVGFSTCFRREAGAYGKDTKGILRVHQFDKVEMVSFCKPEDSQKEHQILLEMEKRLMKSLELPFRVVKICTGDLGRPAAAKYDIEAWIPSENKYRETHSTSNCTDFQARRLNIRYRSGDGLEFVHTLNGTAFAIGRMLIAIIENCQQKDGAIEVPKVLQKYTGFKKIG